MSSVPKPGKPSALIKPTLDTRFFIDYDWWSRSGEDLRIYLLSHLPPEQRERIGAQGNEGREVDFIDPDTGEVSRVDELGLALRVAASAPDFLTDCPTVDAVFRVFLRNNNTPTRLEDIAEQINADPKRLLDLLRKTIYKGIRPYVEDAKS